MTSYRFASLLMRAVMPALALPVVGLLIAVPILHHEEARHIDRRLDAVLDASVASRLRLAEAVVAGAEDQAHMLAALAEGTADAKSVLGTAVSQSRSLRAAWLVGPDGAVKASDGLSRPGRIAGSAEWLAYARRPGVRFTGAVPLGAGGWGMRVIVPAGGADALVATFDTAPLQRAMRVPDVGGQLPLETRVVDADGRIAASTDAAELGRVTAEPAAREALLGRSGRLRYRDAATGELRAAAYVPFGTLGWGVVVSSPTPRGVFASVPSGEALALAWGALCLAVAAGASLSLTRRLGGALAAPAAAASAAADRVRDGQAPEPVTTTPSRIAEVEQIAGAIAALSSAYTAAHGELETRSSELSLANRKLQDVVGELRRLDALRGEFLNALTHDLRIPLTAIRGYAELLEDQPGPEAIQAYVPPMTEAIARMATMIDALLDYARVEAGQLTLNCVPLDLAELVGAGVAFFAPLAAQKGQRLTWVPAPDTPPVMGDPERLRSVVDNVLANALKYTPEGGRITAELRQVPDGVSFAVTDTGVGLSPEDRAHLFERFYRSSRAEVRREKGTGLGLAIVKDIVEAHGGRVSASGDVGEGTRFEVVLPAGDGAGAS